MKSILSPYDDLQFNEYLLQYLKCRLKKHISLINNEDRKYYLDGSRNYFTPEDILESLGLNGRVIRFNNRDLINHAVYDLSQRFWYDEMKNTTNLIYRLYLEYKRQTNSIQQRKLSREKKSTYVR
jgi:hypothetical protein